jgi:outer membrane protein assembly factor BamA
MSTLARFLVIALLLVAPSLAHAQETTPPDGTRITSAQVSGLDLSRLSPGLQEDIGKLNGSPLDRQKLRDVAARLEAEQPRYVAAVRVTPEADGSARVVFVVARMRDAEQQANINAKYIVERVEIRGVSDSAITPEMRAELQALTGKTLDAELAERLEARLKSAFTDYNVERRTNRGHEPGHIKMYFQLTRTEESRWLRYEPLDANALYHSDQGWGAKVPLTMSGGDFMIVPRFAFDVGDDLIEEYAGFGLRFESRKLGT